MMVAAATAGLALWAWSSGTVAADKADKKESAPRPVADSAGLAVAAQLFTKNCELCHGKTGHGDGPGAAALNPKPRKFADPKSFKSKDDDGVFKVISKGGAANGLSPVMPPWEKVLTRDQIWLMVSYVRGFAARESLKKVSAK
jgi:mono/diheme cytochrome c family protein